MAPGGDGGASTEVCVKEKKYLFLDIGGQNVFFFFLSGWGSQIKVGSYFDMKIFGISWDLLRENSAYSREGEG